jgi:hypothetical protein
VRTAILLVIIILLGMLGLTMCRGSIEEQIDPSTLLQLIPTSGPPVISVDGQPVNVPEDNSTDGNIPQVNLVQADCPVPEPVIPCPTFPPPPTPTAVPALGLGVSAVEIRTLYEGMGFTFQDSISDSIESGEVYEYGRAADGYDVVEFSGHPEEITHLTVNGTLIEGDDVNNTATAMHLLSTFNRLTPTWIDSDDWLADILWQATLTETDPYNAEMTQGTINYTVEISASLGSIVITARRAQ